MAASESPPDISASQEDLATPSSRRDALLCALLIAVCVLIAYPVSSSGYLDDFSYAKMAQEFAQTGHMVYNQWATAMLGWQIPWGALFIKLFGFSFTVLRLSILPIAMASVYLFHRILTGFGVARDNAFAGVMTLGLTPLFFPLTTSFMTDIPGLFVLLVSIRIAQLAAGQSSARATAIWLMIAAMLSLTGGTVRQTSWLGALVIGPSTGWMLRKRPGVFAVSLVAALASLVGVLACMRWLARQPHVFHEPSLQRGMLHLNMTRHLFDELLKACLCLGLLTLPVIAGWLIAAKKLTRLGLSRILVVMGVAAYFISLAAHRGRLDQWLMPWLTMIVGKSGSPPIEQLFGSSVTLPAGARLAITILAIAMDLLLAEQIFQNLRHPPRKSMPNFPEFKEFLWICGPFSLCYPVLLLPRAAMSEIFDRYLLRLLPVAITLVLLLHRRGIGGNLPAVSWVVLAVFAIYTVGGTHDFYADERAGDAAVHELRSAGVLRMAISQSFAANGWLQLDPEQRIDTPGAPSPLMESKPLAQQWIVAPPCSDGFAGYTPVLQPKYYVVGSPSSCLDSTRFPSIPYRAWLPSFDRQAFIEHRAWSRPSMRDRKRSTGRPHVEQNSRRPGQ